MSVTEVMTEQRLLDVIETREPQGLFLYDAGDKVIGVDNSTGDAWTEEFPDREKCLRWLTDQTGGRGAE